MMPSGFDEDADSTVPESMAGTSVKRHPGNQIEPPVKPTEPPVKVEELIAKCQDLLRELEEFRIFVAEAKSRAEEDMWPSINVEKAVGIRYLNAPVLSELKILQKLSESDQSAENVIHNIKSSNLPFYLVVWQAAKASRALVGFSRRFVWDRKLSREAKLATHRRFAVVDMVTHDGAEWVKVSTVTEYRLLFDLAKAQWEEADSSESEAEAEDDRSIIAESKTPSSCVERLSLVRSADELQRASQFYRIRYSYPRIRIILTKISYPPSPQLLPVIDRLRSTGAIIEFNPEYPSHRTTEELRRDVFPKLLPCSHPLLTSTLNIDCTILLALVSDLSHSSNLPVLPGYNKAIQRQIELETKEHLLPRSLWPAMSGKTLVCTAEAAIRMREIVNMVATPSERARTEILLESPEADQEARTGDELRAELAKHSDYAIPRGLLLPIKIVPSITTEELKAAIESGQIAPVASKIADELMGINRSIFMYGWCKRYTTVTSNRTVTKAIEATVKKAEMGVGPEIWLREPARSLLGKEKERR